VDTHSFLHGDAFPHYSAFHEPYPGLLHPSIMGDSVNYLTENGYPAWGTVLQRHDHSYGIADLINEDIWTFLESKILTCEPRWINADSRPKIQARRYAHRREDRFLVPKSDTRR
jgi:hypothetical protein